MRQSPLERRGRPRRFRQQLGRRPARGRAAPRTLVLGRVVKPRVVGRGQHGR